MINKITLSIDLKLLVIPFLAGINSEWKQITKIAAGEKKESCAEYTPLYIRIIENKKFYLNKRENSGNNNDNNQRKSWKRNNRVIQLTTLVFVRKNKTIKYPILYFFNKLKIRKEGVEFVGLINWG